jgi:tetratricopeptide (TPR) repeat protein
MRLFTTSEVAKILNLRDSRIRSFVRAGFLAPARGNKKSLQFTFQDVLFLKTAKGLLDSHVPSKRVVRMLSSLKRQLAKDRHLASLKIYADGERVIAWDGKTRWQPDSGQFLFNFDARTVMQRVKISLPPPKPAKQELNADNWFNLALELENSSAKEAQQAYHRALELDPQMAAAHLNLGKLYHDAKETKKAEAHYQAAIASAPEDPAPLFNLGVLMEDIKQPQKAIAAYRAALRVDPSYADAHYNLGLVLDRLGNKSEAFSHLRTARKIYLGK